MRLLASLLLVLGVGVALAEPATGNDELDAAIALYDDLEYERAATALEAALAHPDLTRQEQTVGYRYLALSHVALGDDDGARAALRALLAVDPDATLPETENPHAIELLDEVRAEVLPLGPTAVTLAAHVDGAARAGAPIDLVVEVVDEGGQAARVVVHHRPRGQKGWSQVDVAGGRATIPGALVTAPVVEYYVEALAGSGEVLAAAGSAAAPLSVAVARERGAAAPVYKRWWFWAAVGGAVATAALIGIAVSGSEPGDATVTITVEPP